MTRLPTALKWGTAIIVAIGLAGLIAAFRQGRFPGLPVDGRPTVLVGARVYDPGTDAVIPEATVVVMGREIVDVGRDLPPPEGARVIDLSGLTLLPGLVDSHVHLSAVPPGGPDAAPRIGWLSHMWRFMRRFPERRRALIAAGVTSVKSMGDPHPWVRSFARRIADHELAGPRVFAAGPWLTAPGGHPVAGFRAMGQGDTSFLAQVARQLPDTAAARRHVDALNGDVDFVSAVLEAPWDPDIPRLPTGVAATVIDAAHGRGLTALVHVSSLRGLARALAAAADGVEGVPDDGMIDSITLAELRERRVVVDPMLEAVHSVRGLLMGDTAAVWHAWANVARLHDADVPVVAGSDAPAPGTFYGGSLHRELANLVEAGFSPREAISAATYVAALHLGVEDRLGSVAPGMVADLIAVAGDPLRDITATRNVRLVIADGQLLVDRLGTRETPGQRRTGVMARRDGRTGAMAGLDSRAVDPGRAPRSAGRDR